MSIRALKRRAKQRRKHRPRVRGLYAWGWRDMARRVVSYWTERVRAANASE